MGNIDFYVIGHNKARLQSWSSMEDSTDQKKKLQPGTFDRSFEETSERSFKESFKESGEVPVLDFKTFCETAPMPLAVVDQEGRIIFANRADQAILGLSEDSYIGSKLSDHYGEAASETLETMERESIAEVNQVFHANDKIGSKRSILLRICKQQQGRFVIFAADVTEERRSALLRDLQYETTMLLVGAGSISQALSQLTERIKLLLDYDCGLVWKADEKSNRLDRVVFVADEREEHEYLLARSVSIPMIIGAGFPATSWFSGKCENLSLSRNSTIFNETDSRLARNYKSALVFPINIGKKSWGLMAFFSAELIKQNEDVISVLNSIGLQIGQFVDRIEANEAYLKAQERYYVAITGSNDGIWDWDLLSNEVFYSSRYKEQLGFEETELEDNFDAFRSLCHPEDYPRVMDEVQNHIERKTPYDVEFRMMTKAGQYKWISARGQAIWNSMGRPVRMAGSHRDIDQIKAAEQERLAYERKIQASEAMFRQLAENIKEVFWIFDLESRSFLYASPAYEEFFEGTCQDLYRDPETFYSDVHPEDLDRVQATLQDTNIADTGKDIEFRIKGRSTERALPEIGLESQRWLWSRVFPVKSENGKTIRLCGIAHDITEKKEVERRVGEFYATVSHELRTPLTAIRAALGLIEGGLEGGNNQETIDYTTVARENCDRLIRLINDILDIRKLEAKKLELKTSIVNAVDTVLHTIESLKAYSEQRSVKVLLEKAEPVDCLADKDRLIQILTNLISNAIKFTPQGSQVLVGVTVLQDENSDRQKVKFSVKDQGPGIKENEKGELFGLFQQLSRLENEENTGSGLGLAISKALVEEMQGEIGVESKTGEGAHFWFTIPRPGSMTKKLPDLVKEQSITLTNTLPCEPARLLILEDSDSIAMLLKAFLGRKGFQTKRAASVAQAKDYATSEHFDLIFADIHLPDGNGIDFINWLHARQSDLATPVVVLSGAENPGHSINNPHLIDYVRKPFDGESLLKILAARLYRGGRLH